MELVKTQRGFELGQFKDRYGVECSIQKSSLASEDAIWLGVSKAEPIIMATDAQKLGLPTSENVGWVKFDMPKEVSINTRMHLTQDMVKELLPILQRFVETGEI